MPTVPASFENCDHDPEQRKDRRRLERVLAERAAALREKLGEARHALRDGRREPVASDSVSFAQERVDVSHRRGANRRGQKL